VILSELVSFVQVHIKSHIYFRDILFLSDNMKQLMCFFQFFIEAFRNVVCDQF
jgi:hypothetical protein